MGEQIPAKTLEQVGYIHPTRALNYKYHTYCSGKDERLRETSSNYEDHRLCFAVYRWTKDEELPRRTHENTK